MRSNYCIQKERSQVLILLVSLYTALVHLFWKTTCLKVSHKSHLLTSVNFLQIVNKLAHGKIGCRLQRRPALLILLYKFHNLLIE